jgi:hypothetical protein
MPTWIIDGISEGTARVEEDGERMLHVPAWLLPDGAKAGLVLRVEREASGQDRVRITVAVDAGETKAATRRSAQQIAGIREESGKNDPGGDVSL